MKILQLDLRAFGPFTNRLLDLSAGREGLHLIYGANEAGKTSSLRALRQLLYGIPASSSDDFVHKKSDLRIGATLVRRDGSKLEFVRRKGNKGTLLAADEKATLDDSALHRFLGSCDQPQFETMFGIDHTALVAGGKEIVCGKGDIGHVLFAAGAGIADLRTIRTDLEKQAEALFSPRGKNPALNLSLSALKEAKQKIRDSQLPSSEWKKHQEAVQDTAAQLAKAEEQFVEASRQKARLDRLGGALPPIGRLKQIDEQLAALGNVPQLADDFTEIRRQALSQLEAARLAETDASSELVRLDELLARTTVPEDLLARAAEIEKASRDLSVHRKAQSDLPGLSAQRDLHEKEAATLLRELQPDLPLADVEKLKLARRQVVDIQNLGNRQKALEEAIRQSSRDIAQSQRRHGDIADQLAKLPPPRDPAVLADALRQARSQGSLAQQAESLRAELHALRQQAQIDLRKLGLWTGTLDGLETLAVPSSETIARFERELSEGRGTVQRLQNDRDKSKAEIAKIAQLLDKLRLEGDVPAEENLTQARLSREQGWQLVLGDWQNKPTAAEALKNFLASVEANDLATAYERSVRKADDMADRLRREANRVATRATLETQHQSIQQRVEELSGQLDAALVRLNQADVAWQQPWQPLGIEPLPPREMQAWSQRQQALVQKAEAIRQRTAAFDQLDVRIAAHCRKLQASLAELGGDAGNPTAEPVLPSQDGGSESGWAIDMLLTCGDAIVETMNATEDARRQFDREALQLAQSLADARTKAQQAEDEMAAWKLSWATAIEPLRLSAGSTPEAVNEVIEQTNELFSRLKDSVGFNVRMEGIQRDAQSFRQDSERLLQAVGERLPATGERFEDDLEKLFVRLRQALADQKNHALLKSQRTQHDEKRRQAQAAGGAAQTKLDVLCKEAGCANPDDLPGIERASAEAATLRKQRQICCAELLQRAAGATIDDLIEEAATISSDSLPGELQQIDATLADLEHRRSNLNQKLGSEKTILSGMQATAVAADAAEEVQDILARLEPDVRQYLRLRLASAVLKEGIERYRKKNEGPVLARASELFARLTLGSFDGLRIDFDDGGEQVLAGIRPGGAIIVPTAMSDGAADQLYLALRLASLETWLERNEPIPFIVDDILVSFDNRRATATLEVLAELSRRTQVLFFAHHEHLVDLATQCIASDALFVHKL